MWFFAGHFISTSAYCFRTIQIQGMLGLQIYIFTVQKDANVAKSHPLSSIWCFGMMRKGSLSHSLPFLSSKHFSALSLFRHLVLNHLRSFLRRAWVVKNMMEQSDKRPLETGQEYIYLLNLFSLFCGGEGIKWLSQRQRNAAKTWAGAPAQSSPACPSLGMPWAHRAAQGGSSQEPLSCAGSINPPLLCSLDLS